MLVQGNGWSLGSPRRGAYVGNVQVRRRPRGPQSPKPTNLPNPSPPTPPRNLQAVPRLSIPAIQMQDAAQGFRTMLRAQVGQVTSFPCLLALGATWDRGLARRYAAALAAEMRVKGANVVLGPSVNVHRVARNGRNAEYLSGEDGHLGAPLAAECVQSYRGLLSPHAMAYSVLIPWLT